jgi:hypothetical protein
MMNSVGGGQECVNKFDDVFQTCGTPAISIVKAKIIQALIQIERPTN